MNCDYVEQLLPLYVGGDLEERSSRLISAHLQRCPQCASAADEYAGANQLLRQFGSPVFPEEVYASIRMRVLNEIERESHSSTWPNAIWRFFTPLAPLRLRMVTAGLVLVMLGTVFYFFANRSNQPPDNREVVNSAPGNTNQQDSLAGVQLENLNAGIPSTRSGGAQHGVRRTTAGASDKKVINAGPGMQGSRRREKVGFAQRGEFTRSTSGTITDVAVSERPTTVAPLRVEMQTADPNIRIIWLSNQHPQSGVKETSKGL